MTTYFHKLNDIQPAVPAVTPTSTLRHRFDSTQGLSIMLLATIVSALVVVADQVIDTWADGHLMMAWVALWVVAFAALALFSDAAYKLAAVTSSRLNGWSKQRAQARSDEQFLQTAKRDPRIMADLQDALARKGL